MQKKNLPVIDESADSVGPINGRILKVKQGYNPNSSSLGSIVFSLPVTLMGVSTLFGFVASTLLSAMVRRQPSGATPRLPEDQPEHVENPSNRQSL